MSGYIDPSRPIAVMGIINVTPDSFYAGSRCIAVDGKADESVIAARVERMLEEGADIIDIGACSTRPGSEPCSAGEEWKRLEGALQLVHREFPRVRLSVDTFRPEILRRSYDTVGDFIANDISAAADPLMLPTVAALGLTYIATHNAPATDGGPDIVQSVREHFRTFGMMAAQAGIRDWILDPGFGFGKSVEQNFELLSHLDELEQDEAVRHRILVGISRKSMIYKPLGLKPEDCLAQTQVLHLAALQRGADILRVHDVAEAVRTLATYRRLEK